MTGALLLTLIAGQTQVRGLYAERVYTGACDREGVPGWADRPTGGKRLFVRVDGDQPAPALAETVTKPDGNFAMGFQPPAAGRYCVAHQGKERLVCLSGFEASVIEGAVWVGVTLGPTNPRPPCVSQRRKVRGQTRFVEEPCADAGKPPRPLGNKRIWAQDVDTHQAVALSSDAAGRFEANLLPGRYCFRTALAPIPPSPIAPPQHPATPGDCPASVQVADRDIDDVNVDFTRACGDPTGPHKPGLQEPLPAQARGVGRVRALDGTRHVRGQVTHQTTYWGGAYRRDPPPAISTGQTLRVRRGDSNGTQPLVAEVVTDEQGFDIALPPGVWCLETQYHDEWFKTWKTAAKNGLDGACMRRRYETCDYVARVGPTDIEGVRINTTQWHPPSFPCRLAPYTGSSPP